MNGIEKRDTNIILFGMLVMFQMDLTLDWRSALDGLKKDSTRPENK